MREVHSDIIIVGGGMAGLSAAVYLCRAQRDTLVVDEGKSMARWEPDVQNYLGFPGGIDGEELVHKGRAQARRYGARFVRDGVDKALVIPGGFRLSGHKGEYTCRRLLLATGIFHIPPDLPDFEDCLGHSMFFCKDCDGYRVNGKCIAVYGVANEAVKYALGMLLFSPRVFIVLNGKPARWDEHHVGWIKEYEIPVCARRVVSVDRHGTKLKALCFEDGTQVEAEALFTTRGDVYFNKLARDLNAEVGPEGEIRVDLDMRTSVRGLYAAGCVTPANCQMIIAAGQGATAAQAINRDLFEESLATHALRRYRATQMRTGRTRPRTRRAAGVAA
jgi:thioredoxin reductase (NADPH)